MRLLRTSLLLAGWLLGGLAQAEGLRLGVLKFGTVSWEVDTISHHGLASRLGLALEVTELASPQALKIAVQAEAVDVVVADWVWVARQRAAGQRLSFLPYSFTVGGLVIPRGSDLNAVDALRGKRLGIGGGALDKTWILLQALARQRHALDLNASVEKVFAAPPLINQQVQAGAVDAAINYWHYVARLEAAGHRQLLSAEQMLDALGVEHRVPFLGFVFRSAWAETRPQALRALLAASRQAKQMLCTRDGEWQRIAALVKAEDEATSALLRRRYCEGAPQRWGPEERQAAARIFAILRDTGGAALVGDARELDPLTFWPGLDF